MAITVPPVRGAGDLGHVDDSNVVRQALLDLDTAATAHAAAKGDVHGFRWDETVGRRLFAWDAVNGREQMIYGDTGWRDVSSSLENGWTGSLFLRRRGYTTEITGSLTWGSTPIPFSLPAAYQPIAAFKSATRNDSTGDPVFLGVSEVLYGYGGVVGNQFSINVSWSNIAPWPASLPGTALGPIPTGLVMDTAELLPAEES